jgi:hypothetical protein
MVTNEGITRKDKVKNGGDNRYGTQQTQYTLLKNALKNNGRISIIYFQIWQKEIIGMVRNLIECSVVVLPLTTIYTSPYINH